MKNSNLTCTFTGHRPERLELLEQQVIQWLDEQIRQAINDGYTEFITGMQRGVNIWAAEAVLKLRNEGKTDPSDCSCCISGNGEPMGKQLAGAVPKHYFRL